MNVQLKTGRVIE